MMLRIAGWIAVALSIVVLVVFASIRLDAMLQSPPAADAFNIRYVQHPLVALAHIVPGLLFLSLAPLQFNARLRRKHVRLHRWLGRGLLACAAISGVFALVAAFRLPAFGGIATQAATVFFGVIFLVSLGKALWHIRHRQIDLHRQWMIRALALAMGVATIRLCIGLFTALGGFTMEEVFGTAFWLGLGTNLVLAELWINRTQR